MWTDHHVHMWEVTQRIEFRDHLCRVEITVAQTSSLHCCSHHHHHHHHHVVIVVVIVAILLIVTADLLRCLLVSHLHDNSINGSSVLWRTGSWDQSHTCVHLQSHVSCVVSLNHLLALLLMLYPICLLSFETRAHQVRLQESARPNYGLLDPIKLGEVWAKCLSQFSCQT